MRASRPTVGMGKGCVALEDREIVELYWMRRGQAVEETQRKYGRYCGQIALRLLGNGADAEECVNDALQAAWDSIPPNKPENLGTYLGKLTRRICMKRWRSRDTQKRGGGELPLSLEELGECVPDGRSLEDGLTAKELAGAIDGFLRGLPQVERRVFVLRYWHGYAVKEIADRCGFSRSKVESMLHRTRGKLRKKLQEEGYL